TDKADPALGYVLTVGVPVDSKIRPLENYTDVRVAEADSRYFVTKLNGASLLAHVEHLATAAAGGGTTMALLSGKLNDLDPTTLQGGKLAAAALDPAIGGKTLIVTTGGVTRTVTFDPAAPPADLTAAANAITAVMTGAPPPGVPQFLAEAVGNQIRLRVNLG